MTCRCRWWNIGHTHRVQTTSLYPALSCAAVSIFLQLVFETCCPHYFPPHLFSTCSLIPLFLYGLVFCVHILGLFTSINDREERKCTFCNSKSAICYNYDKQNTVDSHAQHITTQQRANMLHCRNVVFFVCMNYNLCFFFRFNYWHTIILTVDFIIIYLTQKQWRTQR